MAYKELKKFFYYDSEKYKEEYTKRFNSDEAIKINFKIGENQAFFLLNTEVFNLGYKIQKTDKDINMICNLLPGVALNQYSKKCLIDEIVLTNKIEGVLSSRKEIGEALDTLEAQASSKGKKKRFESLVNKYLKLISGEKILMNSCEDIRNIYNEIFLDEIIGEEPLNKPDGKYFRKGSVSVYSETGKEIHKGLFPEEKIISSVKNAVEFLNDESIDDLFRICIFHYLIEYIHPFYDGNGRLGRFILSYGISSNLNPLIAFRISGTVKENIREYYNAFSSCNDSRNMGDLTTFLIMQLSLILKSMESLKESLSEKHMTWGKYELEADKYCNGNELLRNLYTYLIQASLFSEKGISMDSLTENMKISIYTAKKLMALIPDDYIIIKKKGNFKFYSLDLNKLNYNMTRQ